MNPIQVDIDIRSPTWDYKLLGEIIIPDNKTWTKLIKISDMVNFVGYLSLSCVLDHNL